MDPAFLFNNGQNVQAHRFLGSHRCHMYDQDGVVFRVWAPQARQVSLVGEFNDWDPSQQVMNRIGNTGIWEAFRADIHQWTRYQYCIYGKDNSLVFKADPFAFHQSLRPDTHSLFYEFPDFEWTDQDFIKSLPAHHEDQPLNIYELHLGSWRRYPDGNYYSYRDIAPQLADYCVDMGYNAIELMPISEHPLDDSWGYQVTGYFAPTSRFGTPDDLRYFVNHLHSKGIRVFLDWVPAHFPKDAFGLYRFDGSPCYEYSDPRLGEQQAWGTMVFDYAKAEVRSFLLSSAYYFLDVYHFDGLRIDAVSSMIYLDYGRDNFVTNKDGGRDNLEALAFMRELNSMVQEYFPHAVVMAEESTAYPFITKPLSEGGLGFTHKWNMGWMHDVLDYFSVDYYARKHVHNKMTFSMTYAFSEHFILPLSHDEVVHGKRSLIGRMPGDIWRNCASLKTLFTWQIGHPGHKLSFMGNEFGQFIEWRFKEELQWFMLEHEHHRQIQAYVKALNHLYLKEKALWGEQKGWDGFHWLLADDSENSIFSFERIAADEKLVFVLNLTPKVYENYPLPLEKAGSYELLLNSDDAAWGGSSYMGAIPEDKLFHSEEMKEDHSHYLDLRLPPLAALIFKEIKD